MLIFVPLAPETVPLPGGAIQVTASLTAGPGPSAPPPHPVDATALQKAATAFRAGPSDLSEMFDLSAVGEVDEMTVTPDGGVHIVATVTDPGTVRKVEREVLRAVAVAVRVRGREPEIAGISLVDRPDDGFARLAKAWALPASPIVDAALQIETLAADVLGFAARLRPYERTRRR